jgi:hypothetical protein
LGGAIKTGDRKMSGTTRFFMGEVSGSTASAVLTRLNLIFHGPFIFLYYKEKDVVEVVTVSNAEHVVGAGNWLDETAINNCGVYYLMGVHSQKVAAKEPKGDCHAVIKCSDVTIDLGSVSSYRFVLPRPFYTEALAPFKADKNHMFVGADVDKVSECKSLGTAHVLSYELKPDDAPQLDGVQWLPTASHDSSSTVNLHIYTEAPFRLDPDHPVRDFGKQMKIFPGLSLALARPLPKFDFVEPKDRKDLGLLRGEQGGLRGLPPDVTTKSRPPVLCDAASVVVTKVIG